MTRTETRAAQGVLFGVLAAPGWALVQWLTEGRDGAWGEMAAHPWVYGYLLVGATAGFAVFGAMLGVREDALERLNRQLDALAVSDPLTGLKNARYFRARLEEARAAALRAGEPLSVLMLDLDRFKEVNDRFGHPAGDRVLRAVADAIASVVRDGDTAARLSGSVARMGGEEFAVVLPGADEAAAAAIGERILEAIRAAALMTDQGEVRVSASGGVAVMGPDALDADALYARADQALYAAKAAGRDRMSLWVDREPEAGGAVLPGVAA
jgi:diguanylate cyclase (GGDEF)-like protein